MSEPDVASSDPNNLQTAVLRDGNALVPLDTLRVKVVRNISLVHHHAPEGHCEILFTQVHLLVLHAAWALDQNSLTPAGNAMMGRPITPEASIHRAEPLSTDVAAVQPEKVRCTSSALRV